MAGPAGKFLAIATTGASNFRGFWKSVIQGIPWYTSLYGSILSFQMENPSRRTDAVVAPLLKALTVGDRVQTLPIPGGRIQMPMENVVGIMISIYEVFIMKEYERYPDYLPARGSTVIDVGAYVGLWTIHVSREVGDGGRVVAVEPHPFVYSQLERNVALNRLANVELVNSALGDYRGMVQLYGEAKESSLASMFRDRVELYTPDEKISAMTTRMDTIDGLLQEAEIKKVDLVKIDAEGAEVAILKGARRSLESGLIDRIIVEVHQDRCSNQEVAEFLRGCRFAIDHDLNDPDPHSKKGFVFASLRR